MRRYQSLRLSRYPVVGLSLVLTSFPVDQPYSRYWRRLKASSSAASDIFLPRCGRPAILPCRENEGKILAHAPYGHLTAGTPRRRVPPPANSADHRPKTNEGRSLGESTYCPRWKCAQSTCPYGAGGPIVLVLLQALLYTKLNCDTALPRLLEPRLRRIRSPIGRRYHSIPPHFRQGFQERPRSPPVPGKWARETGRRVRRPVLPASTPLQTVGLRGAVATRWSARPDRPPRTCCHCRPRRGSPRPGPNARRLRSRPRGGRSPPPRTSSTGHVRRGSRC